jgi:hypothetical protein
MSDFTPVQPVSSSFPGKAATIFQDTKIDVKEKQAHHVLWQDKDRAGRGPLASPQPGPYKNVMRTAAANNSFARVQNRNSHHKKLAKASAWLEPILQAKLKDRARSEGLSVSATIAGIIKVVFRD